MSEEQVVAESTPQSETETQLETNEGVQEESPPQETKDVDSAESSTEKKSVIDAVKDALTEDSDSDDSATDSEQTAEVKADDKEEIPDLTEDQKQEQTKTAEDVYLEPEGLKPKAQERFQKLVESNKTKDKALEEAQQAVGHIQKTIADTGITSEEFTGLLDYARLAVSNKSQDKQQAISLLKEEIARLAKDVGVEEGGVNLLDDFNDLQQRVDDYDLSREDALELANARRAQARQQQDVEARQMGHAQQDTLNNAVADVEKFMVQMKKTDIDFVAKEKYLMNQVESIRTSYPPEQWGSIVQQLYGALGSMASNQAEQVKRTAQAPMQSSGVAGGSPQNAGSMASAIMQELGK